LEAAVEEVQPVDIAAAAGTPAVLEAAVEEVQQPDTPAVAAEVAPEAAEPAAGNPDFAVLLAAQGHLPPERAERPVVRGCLLPVRQCRTCHKICFPELKRNRNLDKTYHIPLFHKVLVNYHAILHKNPLHCKKTILEYKFIL